MDFGTRTVMSMRRACAWMAFVCGLLVGCSSSPETPGDTTAPVFAADAVLTTTWTAPTELELNWPPAQDAIGVSLYEVRRDGIPVASVLASQSRYSTVDQAPGATRSWAVVAVDAAGNRSEPLVATAPGGDAAPSWPTSDLIVVRAESDTPEEPRLAVTWSPATDDGASLTYEVIRTDTGEVLDTVLNTTSELSVVRGVWPLGVVAVDDVGQRVLGPIRVWAEDDRLAPEFAEGMLSSVALGPGRVQLLWPEANDDDRVARYDVERNGALFTTVIAPTTGVELAGLAGDAVLDIAVFAVDPAGNRSVPLTMKLNPTDTIPPSWPVGAEIAASGLSSTEVTIGWPPAIDDIAIGSYRVSRDGVLVTELAADTTWVTTAVEPYSTPTFSVVPVDTVGNTGPELTILVEVPDGAVPEWPQGAALGVAQLSPTGLNLAWPDAVDDVAVSSYVVRRGAEVLDTIPGQITAYAVTGLSPWTVYTFSVVPVDSAGGSGLPLSVSVKTPDDAPPTWPLSAQVWATNVTASTVTVSWSPASDDVAVTGYRVLAYDQELANVDGSTLEATMDVDPWFTYFLQVVAYDEAGNETVDGPSTTVKTLDDSPPYWADGSALTTVDIGSNTLTVAWPPAIDDVVVVTYRLFAGDVVLGAAPGTSTQLTVGGLLSGTTYPLRLEAVDQAGNISESSLELIVATTDGGPPVFPPGAKLDADVVGADFAGLSWTAATDDVGVATYTVLLDGQVATTVDGFTTSVELQGLQPLTDYALQVLASDAAGNVTDGPQQWISTPPDAFTTETVYDLLRPSCASCHTVGARPYFANETAFVNGIVNNPQWVIPGNGLGSGLVALLDGEYDGSFEAMPPGQWSFQDLVQMGETYITVAEVAEWIDTLSATPPPAAAPPTDVPLNARLSTEALMSSLYAVLGLNDEDFHATNVVGYGWYEGICYGQTWRLPVRSPDAPPGWCSNSNVQAPSIDRWYALGGPGHGANRLRRGDVDRTFAMTYVPVTQAWCRLAIQKQGNTSVLGQATLSDTLPSSQTVIRDAMAAFSLAALGEPATNSELDDLEALFATYQGESTTAAWVAVCSTVLRDPLFLTY